MTRRRIARRVAKPIADPVLLACDLEDWAGQDVARVGRKSALLGEVESLRVVADGRNVEARVRDKGPAPYRVKVAVEESGLSSDCTCGHAEATPCKHAVAVVEALRFPRPELDAKVSGRRRSGRPARGRGRVIQKPARAMGWVLTHEERVTLAHRDELAGRRRRATRERADVRRLKGGGGPPRFKIAGSDETEYVVTLRGNKAALGACTCPDFSKNELATCKHIERVRNWFARRPKRLPKALVSLWWQPREWLLELPDGLRELRVDAPDGVLPQELGSLFEEGGWLKPPPAGTERSAWIERALGEVQRVAEQRGWKLDLDPAVEQRRQREIHGEARRRRLGRIDPGSEVWETVTGGLRMKLHRYQEDGVLALARSGRAFLADDMGLGKTLQAIAAALLLREAGEAGRFLVVCPASLKHQWRQEIERATGESAVMIDSSRAARLEAYRRWKEGFLILNYELVLRDLHELRASRPDLVILDEAQRIKNWETKTAQAVKQLDSPYAFVLTGTPLENRLVELHSIVEFLHPRALGPRWRLFPYHAVTDGEGRVLAYEGLDVLRHRLAGFFTRREREAVLDQLPERTDHVFWTGMTPLQSRVYRRQAARVAALLSRGAALTANDVRILLQELTTMRILCNSLAQHEWSGIEERLAAPQPANDAERRALQSPKLDEFHRVLEDLLDESDSKIVVFSQWERALRLVRYVVGEMLDRRGEETRIFHGGLDGRQRRRVLDDFRERPEVRVLLSTDAGGLGLNLQDVASVVVNLEVPWNPAVLEQRIARVHRLGQRRSVRVLHFVTKGAIEERVRRVVEQKQALFDGLLVDGADRVVLDVERRSSMVDRVRQLVGDSD